MTASPTAKTRAAIVYDYDGTLARGNIQENSFIPSIGMTRESFWEEVKNVTQTHDADEILVYMQLMLKKAQEKGLEIKRETFHSHANDAALFDGLRDNSWFKRLNTFADEIGLALEHYIVSSGTQEMIEASCIAPQFTRIFASRYIYDDNGNAIWPSLAINYTTKTQFLFRINKGVENIWDNAAINAFMPENDRPLPFRRIIFIGDGATDIPAMKMTTVNGGHSIAVYDPACDVSGLKKIHSLIADGRADFIAPADYSENAPMDIVVKGVLGRIAREEGHRPT